MCLFQVWLIPVQVSGMSLEACIPVVYNVHVLVEVIDYERVSVWNIIVHRVQTLYVDHF